MNTTNSLFKAFRISNASCVLFFHFFRCFIDTCTQPYPAESEYPALLGIYRSGTAATLNIRLESKTSEAASSVASERKWWACFHGVWSQPRRPGNHERSRTWTSGWRRPPRFSQPLPAPLWGYLSAADKKCFNFFFVFSIHLLNLFRIWGVGGWGGFSRFYIFKL